MRYPKLKQSSTSQHKLAMIVTKKHHANRWHAISAGPLKNGLKQPENLIAEAAHQNARQLQYHGEVNVLLWSSCIALSRRYGFMSACCIPNVLCISLAQENGDG